MFESRLALVTVWEHGGSGRNRNNKKRRKPGGRARGRGASTVIGTIKGNMDWPFTLTSLAFESAGVEFCRLASRPWVCCQLLP